MVEALDAEWRDRQGSAIARDHVGEYPPNDGAELEAVGGEAEGVEDAKLRAARADDRDLVRHAGFDPGPGPDDGGAPHVREQVPDRARVDRQIGEVQLRPVLVD